MNVGIKKYNNSLTGEEKKICAELFKIIEENLPSSDSKIWHGHPVWFIEDNPIVGYSKLKDSVQLLFWSGQSFKESNLKKTGSFKAAEIRFTDLSQIKITHLKRWLKKAKKIQWDYKNIVKRKGKLIKLK